MGRRSRDYFILGCDLWFAHELRMHLQWPIIMPPRLRHHETRFSRSIWMENLTIWNWKCFRSALLEIWFARREFQCFCVVRRRISNRPDGHTHARARHAQHKLEEWWTTYAHNFVRHGLGPALTYQTIIDFFGVCICIWFDWWWWWRRLALSYPKKYSSLLLVNLCVSISISVLSSSARSFRMLSTCVCVCGPCSDSSANEVKFLENISSRIAKNTRKWSERNRKNKKIKIAAEDEQRTIYSVRLAARACVCVCV